MDHRRAAPRLRVRAEGLSPRDPPGRSALRGDAPLPAGTVPLGRRHRRRAPGEPLAATARGLEIRAGPAGTGLARPSHGQIPDELLDTSDPDLWPPGAGPGRARYRAGCRVVISEALPRDGPGQPATPPAGRTPCACRLPVRVDWAPGRDARSDLSRVTAEACLYSPRNNPWRHVMIRRSRLVRDVCLGLALLVTAAGCGGGSKSRTSTAWPTCRPA